jgi:hypothetical protein
MDAMRRVRYVRHEYPGRTSKREDSLLVLVYDIPYFGACGVFPPLHLLNQLLRSGGSQGGMSPGATWEPLSLSEHEYQALVAAVRAIAPKNLKKRARYAGLPFLSDPAFDHHQDYFDWVREVCEKHRAAWRAKLRKLK